MPRCKLLHGLVAADIVLSIIVIFPCCCFYFAGTWEVWSRYILAQDCPPYKGKSGMLTLRTGPSRNSFQMYSARGNGTEGGDDCDEVSGAYTCFFAGSFFCVVANLFSPLLHTHCTPARVTKPGYYIIRLLYFYVFAFAYIGQWVGVWNLGDLYHKDRSLKGGLLFLAVTLGTGFLLRVSKMAQSTPWEVSYDNVDDVFLPHGWLRAKPDRHKLWFYAMDQLLSIFLIQSLSISIWRGAWVVMDAAILPGDAHHVTIQSNVASVSAGVVWVVIIMLLSIPASKVSARLSNEPLVFKIIWEDFYYVLVNIGVVLSWRGLWNFMDMYIVVNKTAGTWASHVGGFVALNLMCCFRSAFDNGVDLDGGEPLGEGIELPNYYTRAWCETQLEEEERAEKDERTPSLDLAALSGGGQSGKGLENGYGSVTPDAPADGRDNKSFVA